MWFGSCLSLYNRLQKEVKMKKLPHLFLGLVFIALVLSSCSLFGNNAQAELGLVATPTVAPTTIELTVKTDATFLIATNQIIKYLYVVKNTGTGSVPGNIAVTGATCPAINAVGNLDGAFDPGEEFICNSDYTVTQTDIDKGSVINIVAATVSGISSNAVTIRISKFPPITPGPVISITPGPVISTESFGAQSAATATVGAAFTQAAIAQSTVFPTTNNAISQPISSPTLSIQEQFKQVDIELQRSLTGSFSYIPPKSMKLDDSFTIQLLLNPSVSPAQLATQIVEASGFATSVVQSGQLITNDGQEVNVESGLIEVTPHMKAVLMSEDPQAFEIQRLHDNDIQIVSGTFSTSWLWVIKAKKEGVQRLIIVISRLVKIDENEVWREVQTYKSDIEVKVTAVQKIKSLDWKWIVVTAFGVLMPAFWRWYDNKQKQITESKEGIKKVRNS
jgi:hypothetical protein